LKKTNKHSEHSQINLLKPKLNQIKSNQIKFICDTNQNKLITERPFDRST